MQLLIDLGNTRLKWALAESGEFRARGALAHTDEQIVPLLEKEWAALPAVRTMLVASVAPLALDMDIEAFVRQRFGIVPDFRNAYAEPHRLGIDRFLALAAAHAAAARAQVVVGVGTAMTLDALDADGTHLGGWIVPSPALMRDAVLARTARVGVSEGSLTDFAASTADALHSGSLYAASGAVERFCANAARRFQTWPEVVMTGGGADELAALLPGAEKRADLVLEGLALWASAAESPEFVRSTE